DFGITCAHCHVKAEGKIDLDLEFTPELPTVGGQQTYEPGATYQVVAKLVGEHLKGDACGKLMGDTMPNVNNFAAAFEDASGNVAGRLASDSGQSAQSCPSTLPSPPPAGTTATYGDCHAVVSMGGADHTSWTFSWTAPAAGSGPLIVFYGV